MKAQHRLSGALQQVQARLIAQGVTVSWADLVQLAGAAAVESSGGPKIDIIMGRKWAQQPPLDYVLAENFHTSLWPRAYEPSAACQNLTPRTCTMAPGNHTHALSFRV